MIKLLVTPQQRDIYRNMLQGSGDSEILVRLTREFQLTYTDSSKILARMKVDFNDPFQVILESSLPVIPSHAKDTRRVIFLPEPILKTIHSKVEAEYGDPIQNLLDIDAATKREILKEVIEQHSDLVNEEAGLRDLLNVAMLQYPYGVKARHNIKSASVSELKEVLSSQIKTVGSHPEKHLAEILTQLPEEDSAEKISYLYCLSEILRDLARVKLEALKKR